MKSGILISFLISCLIVHAIDVANHSFETPEIIDYEIFA